MAVIVPAAIAAAYGIYKVAHGVHQQNLAKKAAAANVRPTYNIPQTEYDNLYSAENTASQGLDQGSKQIMTSNADRGLATSLNSVLRGGGDMDAAGSLYDNYLGNINNVMLADNQAKVNNMNKLVAARYRMSDQQDKEWQINKYAPYANNAQAIAQQKAYGQSQVDSGVGTIASSAMSIAGGIANNADVSGVGDAKSATGAKVAGAPGGGAGGDNGMMKMLMGGGAGAANGALGNAPAQQKTQDFSGYFPNSPSYGIDISKLKPADAGMVNSVLYGNGNGGGQSNYGPGAPYNQYLIGN